MVYVIFWRVEMVGWRFMRYIIFFIYLIIYKRILACSTSTVYKSPGFFSSFSLIFFFLKQLGATEKKKKKSQGIWSLHEMYGFANGKKELPILLSRSLLLK